MHSPFGCPQPLPIGTVRALTIPINYGIDRVGTVYIAIRTLMTQQFISLKVKAAALAGPVGTRIYTAVIPVTAGNINTILQIIAAVPTANNTYLYT